MFCIWKAFYSLTISEIYLIRVHTFSMKPFPSSVLEVLCSLPRGSLACITSPLFYTNF